MKFNSSLNSMTVVGTVGIILLLFITESMAAGCTQYGHSCWGGHGKRGIPDNVQRQVDANWFLTKLARSTNRNNEPLQELGYLLNKHSIENADAMKAMQEGRETFNGDRRDYGRDNLINAINTEDRNVNDESLQDLLYLAENSDTQPKINLMQLLKNSNPSQQQ